MRSLLDLRLNLDPELFCACRGERSRALGNPGARLSLIGFSKNNKSISDWSIQVCTREVERAACLACEWVFPRNVDVNTAGQFFISAIPKQHLHD